MADDGVGIHAVLTLRGNKKIRGKADVFEAGTRAFDVLEYMNGRKKAIIVDAIARGSSPGTLHRIEIKNGEIPDSLQVPVTLHDLTFADALKTGAEVYQIPPEIVILGLEPKELRMGIELSEQVNEALDLLIDEILREVEKCPSPAANS